MTSQQSAAIDPLDYHGPCEPCRHFANWNIQHCYPCLTPSPTGHNGKYLFEPIPVVEPVAAQVRMSSDDLLAAFTDPNVSAAEYERMAEAVHGPAEVAGEQRRAAA